MKNVKIVLVGIEGSVNLGFIVRLAKNFAVGKLVLVGPRELDQEVVERYAAQARDMVRFLKVVDDMEKAFEPGELRVCTSARTSEDDPLRQYMTPRQLAETYAAGQTSLALVFGRESTGLTRKELSLCHALVSIEANPEYPVLNLSHAVAIILYELYTSSATARRSRRAASLETLARMEKAYERLVHLLVTDAQKARRLSTAFRRMIYHAPPTPLEARSLVFTLSRAVRRLEECKEGENAPHTENKSGSRGPSGG